MGPPDHPSAERLLELMQRGDFTALDLLARTYGARLLAVARRRCQLTADAEDAVQQAFLAASSSQVTFRGEGTALGWLSTLVVRSCFRLNERHAAEAAARQAAWVPEEPEVALPGELADVLADALMRLSRTDRIAFLLSVEGFTSVEIAEHFGLSHDAIRSRLKRARKVLRAALGDDTPARPGRTTGHDDEPPHVDP